MINTNFCNLFKSLVCFSAKTQKMIVIIGIKFNGGKGPC